MGLSDWLQSRRREQGKTRDANVGRSGANGRFYRKPSRHVPGLGTNQAADGQIVGHETRDPDIKRNPDGKFTKDDDSDLMPEIGAGVMESLDPSDSRPTGAALMTEPQSEPQSNQPDTGVLSSEIRDPEIGRQTTAEEWGHGVLDLTTGDRR